MRMRGSMALGLMLTSALAAMALAAPMAQAVNLNVIDEPETGEAGFFLSGGVERPKGLTTETIGGTIGPNKLLIPGKSAEIACSEGKITEGFIANEYENWKTATMKKGGHGHETVLLLGCKVFKINASTGALEGELSKCTEELNKELLAALPASHHLTIKALFLTKRHEGVTYLILEPLVSSKAQAEGNEALTSAFTTLKFGGTCSLPESVNITGGVASKMSAVDENKTKWTVDTFSAAGKTEQALLGAKLKFGANEAFTQYEVTMELTGSGSALSWGTM